MAIVGIRGRRAWGAGDDRARGHNGAQDVRGREGVTLLPFPCDAEALALPGAAVRGGALGGRRTGRGGGAQGEAGARRPGASAGPEGRKGAGRDALPQKSWPFRGPLPGRINPFSCMYGTPK